LTFPRLAADFGRPDDDQRLQADIAARLWVPETVMTRYLKARTAFFDRVVVEAITAGIDQIVVLGAGYDGRCLRYAQPGLRWFELDHPDTQSDKQARLDRLGIDATDVVFAPANFGRDDVASALRQAGHDAGRPSLVLCEGVAAYLPLEALSRLLSSASAGAAAGSTLAISISLETESKAQAARRATLRAAVAGMGEPLVSALPRAELPGFLRSAGWTIRTASDPAGIALDRSASSAAFVLAEPIG
jgi:methyltransferase (TIGR00027 family)